MSPAARRLPFRGWLGLALIALAWPGNWLLTGPRTHLLFFPLWLGYVLLVDGWTALRDGASLWTSSRRGFVCLFLTSVPLWWGFEAANGALGNWEYLGRELFGDVEYALLCSLSFSTVVPAVLVSARWARGLRWIERLPRGPRVEPTPAVRAGFLAVGLALFYLALRWPRTCYPGIWVAGVFLLEPLCLALGRRGLCVDLRGGDWRAWCALWTGGLVCGFFWEMWNWRSYPKWIYHTPFVGDPRLFEMPLAGYLGYLPFALSVYQWKELWLREPELLVGSSDRQESAPRVGMRADARSPDRGGRTDNG
jgi:hypothetical protein